MTYTRVTLAAYMLDHLGQTGEVLGLTADNMSEAIKDVELACGVDDIATVPDARKVRALARLHALTVARFACMTWIDFSADGASFNRSQVLANIERALTAAETDAAMYAAPAVTRATITYNRDADPYQWTLSDYAD